MSTNQEQNKDIVRRYQEAHNSNKLDLLDDIVAADIVSHWFTPGVPPGREGAKMVHKAIAAAFPDLDYQIEELVAEGDKVMARFTSSGTFKGELMGIPPNGKSFKITGISLFRIADGKIVEHWANQNDLGFYQQLGLTPPAA